MGDRTGIEWTDATWNPTTGCDRVSPGCDNCYALTQARRLKAMGSPGYQVDGDPRTSGPGFALQVHPDRLDQPLRWTKPRRIFVNSMSDLFHPKVDDLFIGRVFNVMGAATQHTFQVLTKRPKRMRSFVTRYYAATGQRPFSNVWLGTSVEDQQRADERIVPLLWTPAAVRFLSCEPLLGPVHLGDHVLRDREDSPPLVDWVIVGGESGHGARPMHPRWACDLRDQCTAAGVPFLFKQWGAWGLFPRSWPERAASLEEWRSHGAAVAADGCHFPGGVADDEAYVRWCRDHDHTRPNLLQAMYLVGKHAAGRELDGRTWDEFPEAVTVDA